MENNEIKRPEMVGWMPEAVRLYTDNAPESMKPVVAAVVDTLWGALASNAYALHPLFYKKEYTTLLTAVWAGAGDGKSFMDPIAKEILQPLEDVDDINQKRYETALKEYKSTPQSKRKDEPEAPLLRVLETSITRPALLEQQKLCEDMGQIIWTSEIEEALERGRFTAIRDIVRKSFDGSTAGQRVKSTESFNGHTDIHLSYLVAGTPGQLLKMIGNFEDGLATRFRPVKLPEGWVSDMTISRLTDKQRERLKTFQDIYMAKTYHVADDDRYEPKPRTEYSLNFFLPYAYGWDRWLKEQWEESKDPIYKSFGSRALEMGLRSVLIYLPLYPNYKTDKRLQRQLAEYGMWQVRWAFYNLVTTFGNEIRKVAESQKLMACPCKVQPSVYMLLDKDFTMKDVQEELNKLGKDTPARVVLCKWKKSGLVEKSGKKYKKILNV